MQVTRRNSGLAESPAPTPKPLEIDRTFQVPVEKLFEAFASSEALKAWWWPNGLHANRIDLDFREGGRYFIDMQGLVQGKETSGGMTGEFLEIVENERIAMTDSFANDKGSAISPAEAGMAGQWPEQIFITFDFEAVTKSASRLHLVQQGIPEAFQPDCVTGWSESFDKLEQYLAGRNH